MKQIIRSNAVETLSQRGLLGVKLSELHPRQASIHESLVLLPKLNLSVLRRSSDIAIKNISNRSTSFETEVLSNLLYLVWGSKLDFYPIVVVWVWIAKIVKVSNTQGTKITHGMAHSSSKTRTLGEIIARVEQATRRALGLKINLLKLLLNIQKTAQTVTNIVETKTWLKSIHTQRTQQRSFRKSFFHWELPKPLTT
jgi:hypothetical protein